MELTLKEIIEFLEAEPDHARLIPLGFGKPSSYRGYYEDLMFEPVADTTIAEMLEAARNAHGKTFEGWKGGDYTMGDHTRCWLAWRGNSGGEVIGSVLLTLMLITDDSNAGLDRLYALAKR